MKGKLESHFTQGSRARGRMLALLLPVLSACDSPSRVNVTTQPDSVPTVLAPSSAVSSSSIPPVKTGRNGEPVICINGYLEAGEKDMIINRIRRAFEKIDATLQRINPDNFETLRDDCEGMIAVGGDDLDTGLLPRSEPLHPKAVLTPAHRQTFDETYIRWIRAEKKPLLAECLGMQQMVAYEGEGGHLIQHIPDNPSALDHSKDHLVRLNDTGAVFGIDSLIRVRSRHHQTVREPLPPGLEVAGRSPDGLVEAMTSKDDLVWGIMWHPKTAAQQAIYRNFVVMVKAMRAKEKSK